MESWPTEEYPVNGRAEKLSSPLEKAKLRMSVRCISRGIARRPTRNQRPMDQGSRGARPF